MAFTFISAILIGVSTPYKYCISKYSINYMANNWHQLYMKICEKKLPTLGQNIKIIYYIINMRVTSTSNMTCCVLQVLSSMRKRIEICL